MKLLSSKTEPQLPVSSDNLPERERLLNKYDRAFAQMLARQGASSRTESIEMLKPILFELSSDIRLWTGAARERMEMLMKEISKELDDPATARTNLALLHLIVSMGGKGALEMARPIFHAKIQAMYLDQKYDDGHFLPLLLLMFEDYSPERVERLTRDAVRQWGDERFRNSGGFLILEELKARGLRTRIKGFLGAEIARAGTDFNRTALNRAIELYHQV